MISCDMCGKEFKNTQGLAGHMSFVHGIKGARATAPPAARLATQQDLSELEDRVELGELQAEELTIETGRLAERTKQLPSLVEELASIHEVLPSIIERLASMAANNTKQLGDLAKRLERLEYDFSLFLRAFKLLANRQDGLSRAIRVLAVGVPEEKKKLQKELRDLAKQEAAELEAEGPMAAIARLFEEQDRGISKIAPVQVAEEDPEVIKGPTDKPGYKFYNAIGLKGISIKQS